MNNNGMKKRWISLYVENQVGVLSKISGQSDSRYDRRSDCIQNDDRDSQR